VRVSDGSAQIEVQRAQAVGGVDFPLDERRPADILTSAAALGGVGSVALDVGITTPHTAEGVTRPALDVLEKYYEDKMRKYADVAAAAKWQYRPLIISAYGRAHCEAKKVVHRLALAAGRRFGAKSAGRIESVWWRNCATLLMERACSMVARCRPAGRLLHTLGGVADDLSGRRHPRRDGGPDAGAVVIGADGPIVPLGD